MLDPDHPVSADFLVAVADAITNFLGLQRHVLTSIGAELEPVHRLAVELTSGGKRLRPAFCLWGYAAAAGLPDDHGPLIAAAASLELFHVGALVHDDVIDSSDLRRGKPAAHRQFEALHSQSGWLGDPSAFGRAGAILLGDLLLLWSAEMLQDAVHHGMGLVETDAGQRSTGPDGLSLTRALPLLEAMRTEVTSGQILDVVAQSHNPSQHGIERALDEANRVLEFKSARYTVQRPCQFGAALGAADDQLQQALAGFGSPLGRAFQLRDDLLGVFGDPTLTGKPAGDDLREGKRTVLIAHAYAGSNRAGRMELDTLLGQADLAVDQISVLQQVITESGAKETVETRINDYLDQALRSLATSSMTDQGRTALTALAHLAVQRDA